MAIAIQHTLVEDEDTDSHRPFLIDSRSREEASVVDSSRDQSQGTIASQELRDIVRQQLQGLLEINDYQGAKVLLQPVQYPDIAEAIEGLPETLQALAFRLLPKDEAIEVYEYLDSSVQQALIDELRSQDVLDLVEQMSPDDRVRLFDELPAKIVRRLLQQLSPAERENTSLLLGYGTGTAGRLMTPEYIALKEGMTGDQALARVRLMAPRTETIYNPLRHGCQSSPHWNSVAPRTAGCLIRSQHWRVDDA